MNKISRMICYALITLCGLFSVVFYFYNQDVLSHKLLEFSNIQFNDSTCVYDGNIHSLKVEGDLPEGTVVSYQNNYQFDAGEYEVISIVRCYGYKTLNLKANLTIEKQVLTNLSFDDCSFPYDGKVKNIQISGDLPEGVIVKYENNNQLNAGIYDVTAKIIDTTGNYLVPDSMSAKLEIKKLELDLSNIVFEDQSFTYNGEEHALKIKGSLPEEVKVVYENNNQINANEYNVVANFVYDENYTGIESLNAKLTINRAEFPILNFNNVSVKYDGSPKSILIDNIPPGISVDYLGNDEINAGVYEVTAHMTDLYGNYNHVKDLKAMLTIEKLYIDVEEIAFNSTSFIYDGEEHELVIKGDLPEGIEYVEYVNNKLTDYGYLEAYVLFHYDNNHDGHYQKKAIISIEKKRLSLSFRDSTCVYDGKPHSLKINGEIPSGVEVTYSNENIIDAGTYDIDVLLKDHTGNYEIPNMLHATLTINKAKKDISNIKFENKTYNYDGGIKSLSIEGELPSDVTVTYDNNGQSQIGTYVIVAKFTCTNPNYEDIEDMVAILTIVD